MKAFFAPFIMVFFCGVVGWQLAKTAKPKPAPHLAHINSDHWRIPAAINKTNDFSFLKGAALKAASQRRLLEDIKLVFADHKYGIELGHFVVKGPQGNKQFACEYYDRVLLTFIAEGVAVNGNAPELKIEGHCGISKNINRMVPVWLPLEELKDMPPRNLRSYFFDEQKVFVSSYHVGEFWPKQWRLDSVKVFNEVKADREIAAESKEFEEYRSHPIVVGW